MDDVASIVIDNGSGACKVGFSGDDSPTSVFHAVVGRPRYRNILPGMKSQDSYVGDEAQVRRGVLALKYPMEKGVVANWDDMEKIWQHSVQKKLKVSIEDHPILMTECPMNPKYNREYMLQIMFESFKCPSMYVAIPAVLSLYATGRTTGTILDSGDSVTHSVAIYEGYSPPSAMQREDLGGRDVTDCLASLLSERSFSFISYNRKEIIREIKEKLCMVTPDCLSDLPSCISSNKFDKSYELPDGNHVIVGSERFRSTEFLFSSSGSFPSLQQLLWESVAAFDNDLRRDLFSNVILTGGNTMFPGMVERLLEELNHLLPGTIEVDISADPERKVSTWIGGSIFSSLSCFPESCISKEDYEEFGPLVGHRKCF